MTEEENKLDNVTSDNVTNDTAENTIYELGYLIVPLVPEEKVPEESTKIRDIIEENGNVISSIEAKGRTLAYTMSKVISNDRNIFDTAYFGTFIFETNAENIEKIKTDIEKNDNILRILIMKRTKKSLIPPKVYVIPTPESVEKSESEKDPKKINKKETINEKELDKTIEELVVE